MKVFISWSGKQTKSIAIRLSEFISKILELDSTPFLSFQIPKGETWPQEIIKNLKEADFGIVLLTPKNTLSTWINFEAGALRVSAKKVFPLLFGVDPEELPSPLNQLQATKFSRQDMFMLLLSMNKINGPEKLGIDRLEQKVDMYWSEFSEEIRRIIKETARNEELNEYPDSSDIKKIERQAFSAMRQANSDIELFDRKLQELHLLNDYPVFAKLKVLKSLSLEIPCNSDRGTKIILDNLLFLIAGWDNRKMIEFIGQQQETNGLEWAKKLLDGISSCLSEIKYTAEEYNRSEDVRQIIIETIDTVDEKKQMIRNSA